MVHLGKIPTDKDIENNKLPNLDSLDLNVGEGEDDDFAATVYGSRYAAQDLPKHSMPEGMMPKEVAYRMIKYV